MLNKYPVIAEHFILATRVNKAQTHLLEQDDLEAAYACMEAWESAESHCRRRRLFTFFNSGDHSGASQAHRHLQFLPVENMGQGHVGGSWKLLIDEILAAPGSIQSGTLDTSTSSCTRDLLSMRLLTRSPTTQQASDRTQEYPSPTSERRCHPTQQLISFTSYT